MSKPKGSIDILKGYVMIPDEHSWILYKHITVRAKVTKDPNGYTIEKFGESKFSVGEQFVTASGKLGIVTKVNSSGNYRVQWIDGKYCSAQPENTMRKIVWDK